MENTVAQKFKALRAMNRTPTGVSGSQVGARLIGRMNSSAIDIPENLKRSLGADQEI